MFNSTLLQTLRLFTQEEIERLHLFVDSPIFNEVNRFHDKKNLFEYLKPHYPDFLHERLDRERAAGYLFGERKNKVQELEKAMALLMRIVRRFIHYQYFAVKGSHNTPEEDAKGDVANFARQQLALMRFYSERLHQHPAAPLPDKTDIPDGKEKTRRHAENFFLNQYRKLKEALAKQKEFSHFNEYDFNDILYYRFLLEQEKALFDSLTERRASDGNLLESIESLDRFYLLTKLDMISRLSHLEKLALPFPPNSIEYQRFNDNREATLLFLNALESKNHLASPDIRLYAALLHFLTLNTATESDQAADMFSTLLKDYGASVTVSRVNDFKVMLRAHWARRYRQTRDIRFVERIFRLQMDQLQQIAPTETIPASHLHNIILTSLKLQETNTAEQLLSAYEYRISGTNHPDLCRALWWTLVRIAQKKHAEAARILPHYYVYGDFDDIQMYAVAMMANVKICYELDTLEDELGNNMVRATTKRIREDKTFKPTDKEAQLHFVKLTKAAFRLKQKKRLSKNSPGAELNKLREEIARVNTIDKEWLLEKCGEVVSGK